MTTNLERFIGTYKVVSKEIHKGTYKIVSDEIHKTDGSLTLHSCKRKESTPKKPTDYFLFEEDGKKTYFSSLYPTAVPSVYRAEYAKTLLRVSYHSDSTLSIDYWEGGKS